MKFSIYSGHSSYKVPKNGVVIGYADTDYALTVSANGVKFIQDGRAGSTVVKAGWTVDNSSSTTFTGTFYPFV